METKRLIQLLELVKEYLTDYAYYGICETFSILESRNTVHCTSEELAYLQRYIYHNKPAKHNQYADFMENKHWTDKKFWWSRISDEPETRIIRIAFINRLINNIK